MFINILVELMSRSDSLDYFIYGTLIYIEIGWNHVRNRAILVFHFHKWFPKGRQMGTLLMGTPWKLSVLFIKSADDQRNPSGLFSIFGLFMNLSKMSIFQKNENLQKWFFVILNT